MGSYRRLFAATFFTIGAGLFAPLFGADLLAADPLLPQKDVDVTMPAQTGKTWNVNPAADCNDPLTGLQAALNSAQYGDTVSIPAGAVCYGTYQLPPKSTGSGWIVVRTSTPDNVLPPPGTRITPDQKPLLATIVDNSLTMVNAGDPQYFTEGSACDPIDMPFAFASQADGFPLYRCAATNVWTKVTPVGAGATAPATCNPGDWFHNTASTPSSRERERGWWCIEPNKYVLMYLWTQPAVWTGPGAHHYRLVGLEITTIKPPSTQPALEQETLFGQAFGDLASHHLIIDRCYLHGRGYPGRINYGILHDASYLAVVDSYIDEINTWRPVTDLNNHHGSYAYMTNDSPGPIAFINNYIHAIGISILTTSEGADLPTHVLRDAKILRNHFYKGPEFRINDPTSNGYNYFNRHHLELKKGERWLIEGNIFENNWGHREQGKAVFFFGQSNTQAKVVNDITFRNNIVKNSAMGIGIIAGTNIGSPSGNRFLITNNLFRGIWGNLYSNGPSSNYPIGNYTEFLWYSGGLNDLNLRHNTVELKRRTTFTPADEGWFETIAFGSFDMTPATGFTLKDNLFTLEPKTPNPGRLNLTPTILASQYGGAWAADHNVFMAPLATDYKALQGNYWPGSMGEVGFTDENAFVWRLSASSPYRGLASDGSDPGINADALEAATLHTVDGAWGASYAGNLGIRAPLNIRVFPNPWRSDRPHNVDGVTFANLNSGTVVKIFTVSGHLVRELPASDRSVVWDLKTRGGEMAASGLYLYAAKDASGERARGRFAIIR